MFQNNLDKIEKLNQKFKGETTFGCNQFCDLTTEEFDKRKGVKVPQDVKPNLTGAVDDKLGK